MLAEMKVLGSELGAEDEEAFSVEGATLLLVWCLSIFTSVRFLSFALLGPGKPPGISLNLNSFNI